MYLEEDQLEAKEDRVLLTIMGESASIKGKFNISKSIEIDCDVSGSLKVDGKLTIQKEGNVNASVDTVDAEVIGKYDGSMESSGTVEINKTGVVSGSIKTGSLIINQGGIFSGTVTRIGNI